MKKVSRFAFGLVLLLGLTLVFSTTSALAVDYYHYRTVTKVTEEIINGVMTGNRISVGQTSRAIGYVNCSIPTQTWFRSGVGSQGSSYEVLSHSFTSNKVTWRADAVYYTQLYVYQGSNDPTGPKQTLRNASASGSL